jgi:hypothetical protein
MSDDWKLKPPRTKSLCARCHRSFTPKKQGDRYGPTCARKLAGQIQLDGIALVSGKILKKGKCVDVPIYVQGEKGEVVAVIV